MTFIQGSTLSVTTDASSAASTYSNETFNGLLHGIQYVPSATAFSTNMGATFTAENSGMKLLSLSPFASTAEVLYQPRNSIHSSAGSTVAGFGQFPLANERIRVDLSSGGAAKTGTFRFFVG